MPAAKTKANTTKLSKNEIELMDEAIIASRPPERGSPLKTAFAEVESSLFIRDGMTRRDYKAYRPGEEDDFDFSENTRRNIVKSMWAYKNNGLIRTTVDLMGDFASDGVRFVSTNEKDQKFLDAWAKKVNAPHVTERFANTLIRCANLILQRSHAKITKPQYKKMQRAEGSEVIDDRVVKNRIPWSYSINSPLNLTIDGSPSLSTYVGTFNYSMIIPSAIINSVKNNKKLDNVSLIGFLPQVVTDAIKEGRDTIPLDPDKTRVYHYKKDDWELLAEPILSTILDDLVMLNKLKLADIAALDGIAESFVLWKVGDLEKKILPNQKLLDKLADMLKNAGGGGSKHIFWNPAIDFKESSTEHYKFLTYEKYSATYRSLYEGLGLPYIVTGQNGNSVSSNLSLNILIQRLQYVRKVITQMWERELRELEKAMDLAPGTKVVFTYLNLSDPAAILALYVQLVDRNIISIDTIVERFGEIPEIESLRQRRQQRDIDKGKRLRKASQWHDPEHKEKLEKIALTPGSATPSQVGLDLPPAKEGEKTSLDLKQADQQAKQRGEIGQGRPVNSKDKSPRKKRSAKAFVEDLSKAKKLFNNISEKLIPIFLDYKKKKNVRSLTEAEFDEMEYIKFAALCSNKDRAPEDIFSDATISIPKKIEVVYNSMVSPEMSIDEKRDLMISVYALNKGECNG